VIKDKKDNQVKSMIKNIFSLKKSNEENFRKIYEANFNYVYSFVFSRMTGNKGVTEDIVQETFMAALKGGEKFKGISSYKTWLCGIARNKILNYYRDSIKNDKFSYIEELSCMESTVDVEISVINDESRKIVLDTLNNLKPMYRYVLISKYMDGYSVKEIAKILCKTPKSIDGILQRAKNSFKKEYINILGEESYERREIF
jgi:RNA polymerase sigma-70 factor (ECF subfamily)